MSTLSKDLRKEIALLVYTSKEGHIPSSYSIIDIVNYLYDNVLKFDAKNPLWEDRDFFILSKGHGCAALFVVLKKYGFLTQKDLDEKNTWGGVLGGHPDRTKVRGIEASTGSLGHGIGMAVGIALGLKINNKPNKVFCIIGDGESNEGAVWESALVAAKYQLDNLCVIADHNGSSDLVLPVDNPVDKWRSFGWNTRSIDGHNMDELREVLIPITSSSKEKKPHAIIAFTKKGFGVEAMEKYFGYWHAKVPSKEELENIFSDLEKR